MVTNFSTASLLTTNNNIMRTFLPLIVISVFYLTSCGNKAANSTPAENTETSATTSTGTLPPVETASANTSIKPAFAGQTRVAGAKTTTAVETKMLTKALTKPWGITTLPDGRLLITEKEGQMRIVTTAGDVGPAITGLPAVNPAGQGGLLGLCLDPNFTSNRMIYWTFAEKTSAGNLTAVAKGKLSANDSKIENAVVIYRATPAYDGNLHYGSRIIFDKNGNLYVSTGERSDIETRPQAQSLQSALGKVIRITTDGKPVANNPFQNRNDARPEFFSYGHRNPQGLALHPATGDIWLSEMGPKGGDELNLVKPGKNYGWPIITYGEEYSGATIGGGIGQQSGMEQPVYYWDPVISCSGMTFYSGTAIPEWNNNLFIGGLSSRHIIRLIIENNKVIGEERLLEDEGERFRDVAQGKDGALYAITDSGRLYRLGKK